MSRSSTSQRTSLKRAWIARLFVLWVVLCAGFGAGVMGTTSTAIAQEQQIDAHGVIQHEVNTLREQRDLLKTRYSKLTAKIAQAKRSGDSAKILGGIRLETLLEEARDLADRLYALQTQLKQSEARLEKNRRELLSLFDTKISRLDAIISTTSSRSERSKAIVEINRLKQKRHSYTKATPATPDLNLSALPKINTKSFQDPDEALAAAAELEDAERKLRDPIEELSAKIARIERANRLSKKARDFRDEENFFDETATAGRSVIPNQQNNSRGGGQTDGNSNAGDGRITGNPPSAGRETDTQNEATSDNFAGNGGLSAGGADDMDSGAAGAPEAGEPSNADPTPTTPTVTTNPTAVPGAVVPTDPFAGGGGEVVRSGLDPSEIGSSTPKGNETRDQRLQRLKAQKRKLESRARELKRRARELRQHADNM